ncbi:MAG: hypothetical protein VST68_02395 [Nitrospirota bacterium]|nr:hypothetical protein [Nitrospirota bacterium]
MRFMKVVHGHCRHPRSFSRFVQVFILVLCLGLLIAGSVIAQELESSDPASDAGLGIASALLTVPYAAAKILYAALGGVIGGFTWVLTGGDTETAQTVWEPSFYGTYVITPDHLRGKEPVRFFGDSPYDESYIE